MAEKMVTIPNEMGMHSRAAAQFVAYAYKYDSNISLIVDNKQANAKSILNIIMLGLKKGDEVMVRVEGGKEEEVLADIVNYLENMNDWYTKDHIFVVFFLLFSFLHTAVHTI